jgi:hypothetical protein
MRNSGQMEGIFADSVDKDWPFSIFIAGFLKNISLVHR